MVRGVALLCGVCLVVIIGVTGIGWQGPSVTATFRNFLLDWEQQDYTTAATMTDGTPAVVASGLRSVYRQLGAEDLSLAMGQITVHGDDAQASFFASFDLGRGGLSWNYTGHVMLHRGSSGWRVVWSPSVIVPGLRAGNRLAVLTTMPRRAVLLDTQGRSLINRSPVIELGVKPGKVKHPLRTAEKLAKVTGLAQSDADEMSGQIEAWPPKKFLELVQLSPASYRQLRRALRKVPDLRHRRVVKRLFESAAPVVTGEVATETARTLIVDGEPYRPGTTVGLTGLQQAFQTKLAGKPTTSVVVQNAVGKQLRVLHRWQGGGGSDVRTTISGAVQQAAQAAMAGATAPAAIVAVRAGGGQILGVVRHSARGMPIVSPLDGRYQPGQSFTIVSSAALLASTPVTARTPVKCYKRNPVGQPFANVPAEPNLGTQPSFGTVFAHACSTAFAGLSLRLNSRELTDAAQAFGIGGAAWKLPIPAFPGVMNNPGNNAGKIAADTVGSGSVRVSPLDMALVAGAVDAGKWRAPLVLKQPAPAPVTASPRPELRPAVVTQLRELMRETVVSGAAKAADRRGVLLYGQVGTALLPGHPRLRAIWFVGFRGKVAFAVLVFAKSPAFSPAVEIAGKFAAGLPGGS